MNTDPLETERPRQICLPGQTHVAEGPHDQTGMYVMHHAFRRDLDRFQAAVRATPVDERDTWRALALRWERFAEVLHHHHTGEDEHIGPVMEHRIEELSGHSELAGPGGLEALRAMADEHDLVDPALEACGRGFTAMAELPSDDQRNALDVHVTAMRSTLLDHLRHEETEALPLLQRTLTADDFAATERAAQRAYPVRAVPFLVPWVADGLPADVTARVLGEAGPAYRLLLRLCRPRYTRAERRAFAHA
jgi:hemerythrin-like domain-containing protein